MAGHGLGEDPADRPGGGATDHPGSDAEPGMVVDPGHQLGLAAVGQLQAAHDVHLPQLHRPFPLPAPPGRLGTPAALGFDQAVAHQHPVDRGPRRQRLHTLAGQLVAQPPRPPPRVRPPQLIDHGLDRFGELMGAAPGTV